MDRRFHVHWLLLPATALVAAPAAATTYFTVEQAQQQLLPGQALTPVAVTLTPAQADAIEKASGVRVREKALKVWRAANGGWFYVDQVLGKHEFITYALALDAQGAVTGVEILDYRETYGGAVRNPKWRAQFTGKKYGAPLKLDADIVNLSGATLSSAHITDGVRRLLATHALVVAPSH
jgi:Na+-translocating ferredoxin:NAD+ oxidoreductase RnfG subunit